MDFSVIRAAVACAPLTAHASPRTAVAADGLSAHAVRTRPFHCRSASVGVPIVSLPTGSGSSRSTTNTTTVAATLSRPVIRSCSAGRCLARSSVEEKRWGVACAPLIWCSATAITTTAIAAAATGSRGGIVCVASVAGSATVTAAGENDKSERERRKKRSTAMASAMVDSAASSVDISTILADKPILFDMPVSNNGGRVRLVIYAKGLEDEIMIKAPSEIGGLKSEAYLALNPLGKMPLLVLPDGTSIFESEVISEYLLDKYSDKEPSFHPRTLELRTTVNLAKRIFDIYAGPLMGSMYRAMDIETRAKNIAEINKQLDMLEDIITSTPYVAGHEISTGDTALYPNFVFMNYMLPQIFGWESVFAKRPKLQSWWEAMNDLPAGRRVREEMETALNAWKESGRWDKVGITEHVKDESYTWKF